MFIDKGEWGGLVITNDYDAFAFQARPYRLQEVVGGQDPNS